MITGLKFRFTSKEISQHLVDRAAYHEDRANVKEAELPALKQAMDTLKAQGMASSVAKMSGKGSASYGFDADDPVKELSNDIRDHRNKALVFRLFACHVFDEDYNLEENDLRRLEILK